MIPLDTHAKAHEVQVRAHRALSPSRRVEIAVEMSNAVRRIAREGIRLRHPDYSDEELRRALFGLLYGAALARRVWPDTGAPPP
jgi:hypothetical protein